MSSVSNRTLTRGVAPASPVSTVFPAGNGHVAALDERDDVTAGGGCDEGGDAGDLVVVMKGGDDALEGSDIGVDDGGQLFERPFLEVVHVLVVVLPTAAEREQGDKAY
jgi:hypothetical protein